MRKYLLIIFLLFTGCTGYMDLSEGTAAGGHDAIEKTDSVYTALYTKVNDDLEELFDSIDALNAASGVLVSDDDTTVGYLDGKLLAGEGMDLTVGSPAGDETLTVSGEDATTTNKGVASFSTDDFSVSSGAVSLATTSTAAELNILDGATLSVSELNILDGVTSTASELNILDGVTSTASELNALDGITSTVSELNILDGVTATASELNTVADGITATASEINTVADGSTAKNSHTHTLADGATDVTATYTEINTTLDGATAGFADLNIIDGISDSGSLTAAELLYVDGVTSAIQTQFSNILNGTTPFTAIDLNGNADVSGTLDIGASTTRRVAPAGTFVDNSNGSPTVSSTAFTVSTSVTEDTWESVGPTGGGADNTWTALDSVPSDADWIELKASVIGTNSSSGTPGDTVTLFVYARKEGSAATAGNTTAIGSARAIIDSNSNCSDGGDSRGIKVPVNSRQIELYWDNSFENVTSAQLYLTGWGFNP